jgi:hypothetical protein
MHAPESLTRARTDDIARRGQLRKDCSAGTSRRHGFSHFVLRGITRVPRRGGSRKYRQFDANTEQVWKEVVAKEKKQE